ncbi:MAG: hypothetical protein CMJ25_28105 [Phycisphaerae bacterium]|nr:hypothetical protein [Phycisphaerae bacterium]
MLVMAWLIGGCVLVLGLYIEITNIAITLANRRKNRNSGGSPTPLLGSFLTGIGILVMPVWSYPDKLLLSTFIFVLSPWGGLLIGHACVVALLCKMGVLSGSERQ